MRPPLAAKSRYSYKTPLNCSFPRYYYKIAFIANHSFSDIPNLSKVLIEVGCVCAFIEVCTSVMSTCIYIVWFFRKKRHDIVTVILTFVRKFYITC